MGTFVPVQRLLKDSVIIVLFFSTIPRCPCLCKSGRAYRQPATRMDVGLHDFASTIYILLLLLIYIYKSVYKGVHLFFFKPFFFKAFCSF
jgi:hypothetical protein